MKLAKNRKVLVAIAIVLALVIGASATFAWITSRNQIANEFANEGFANGNGLVVYEDEEEFKFEIGVTTPKTVSIVNTGSSPMLARVTFEEMIKLLANDGQFVRSATSTPIPALPTGFDAAGEFENIRVPFDTDALSGWTDVTGDVEPAIAGLTVYKLTGKDMYKASYEISGVAYSADFKGKLNTTTGKIVDAEVAYLFYTLPQAYTFNSWNKEHNYDVAPFNTATWINAGAGYTPLDAPAATPDLTSFKRSTVNPAELAMRYADGTTTSFGTTTNNFVSSLGGALSTYEDMWFYNEADGYFYWMGVLEGGDSTGMLLAGVHLEATANQGAWQKYEYTLIVAVEGLQANKAALIDTSIDPTSPAAGWMLSSTNPVLDALNALLDDYWA